MNRIKEARKNAGIKQTDLCARLGISQGALSGYENGKFEPDCSVWLRLSQIFNVSVDYLMGGNYAPPAASSLSLEDVALLRKFHALDDMAQARGPFFRRHIPDIPAFNGRLAVKRYRLNEGFPAQSGLQRFLFGGSHCSVPSMYAAVTASSWRCKSSASAWYSSARWLAPSSWHCRRSASAR